MAAMVVRDAYKVLTESRKFPFLHTERLFPRGVK